MLATLDPCSKNYTGPAAPVHGAFGLAPSLKLRGASAERPTASVRRPLTEQEAAYVAHMLSLVRIGSLAEVVTIRDGRAIIALPLIDIEDMATFDFARLAAVAGGSDLGDSPLQPPEMADEAEAQVRSGRDPLTGLTQRQREVLDLMSKGASNAVIAQELGMCVGTVKVHVTAILKAFGCSNRTQAVIRAGALLATGG